MLRAIQRGAASRRPARASGSGKTYRPKQAPSTQAPPLSPASPRLPFLRPLRFSSVVSPSRLFTTSHASCANLPFKLHDIGEGIAEVELLKWHVSPGQAVEEFDVLCEVQSDKSTVELTSPTAGVVKRLGGEEGVVVKVGQLICDIETDGETADSIGLEEASVSEDPAHDDRRPQQDVASESTQGSAVAERVEQEQEQSPAVTRAEQETEVKEKEAEHSHSHSHSESDSSLFVSRDEALDSATSGGQFSGEAAMLPSAPPQPPTYTSGMAEEAVRRKERRQDWESLKRIVKASPAVRTLAARLDVDLSEVKGTGDGGRVTSEDVRGHAEGSGVREVEPSGTSASPTAVSRGARGSEPPSTRVEFGRTRKVMYRAMGDMGSVPHFGYSHTLNLTPLLPYMKALNPPAAPMAKAPYLASDIPSSLVRDPLVSEGREKTTILTFLIKGLLLAMEEHPIMRSRVKTSGEERAEKWLEVSRDPTIAVAVSDPKYGLLTPSLPALTPDTSLSSITSHLSALRRNASKPTAAGHITISSVGPLGESRGAMPVLPPGGGVAICAVGRAVWGMEWRSPNKEKRGVWDWTPDEVEAGGAGAILRCPVGWSGDHRVLEGAELIAFTETWKKYIEEPWRWIKVDA